MEKKDRIRVIFPDYLDGSRKMPPSIDASIVHIFAKALVPHIPNEMEIGSDSLSMPPMLRQVHEDLLEKVDGDNKFYLNNLSRSFIRNWYHYKEDGKKNFIISKNLLSAFEASNYKVKLSNLPTDFCGYIDMQRYKTTITEGGKSDVVNIHGFLVALKDERLTITSFAEFSNGGFTVTYGSYTIDERELTIQELVDKHAKFSDVDLLPLRLVSMSIMYITHAPNDLMKYLYEFPRSEKKAARLKPHYTEKPVTIVGKFFKLPNKYKDDWIQNKGYFGWRWTGVGRSTLKYVWVRPSVPYKKGV